MNSRIVPFNLRRMLTLLMAAVLVVTSILPPFNAPPAAAQEESPLAIPLNALALSGTDGYASIPYSAETNTFSAITIEAWVYRNETNRGETILGNGWQDSYWLGFSSTGKLRFIADGGALTDSTSTVASGRWTHVAVTFDGLTRNFYINGVLDRTTNANPGAITGNPGTQLRIGLDTDPFTSNAFDGGLDEIRLWNVARTPEEIQADMFQVYSAPLPAGLVGYWRLNGNAEDETGEHDGAMSGGLGAYSWSTDAALPHDIRIPQVATAHTLDGVCGTTNEYLNAAIVSGGGAEIYLDHTSTDLWICFHFYVDSSYTLAKVYIDPNHDRLDPAQVDDLRLQVADDDTRTAYAGNGAGQWVITDTFNTLWDAEYAVYGPPEFPYYNAEFRISSDLTGPWGSVIGLGLDPYIPGFAGFDLAGIFPALAVSNLPSTWSSATLGGLGPTRTFSGQVRYQPKNPSYATTPVGGAKLELYGYDPGGAEALVATGKTTPGGNFSLTTNNDFTNHRLEVIEIPKGYIYSAASAPAPGVALDERTIDFGNAGGGTYASNLFTLRDAAPYPVGNAYGPKFLIIAPQSVLDAGALTEFSIYKSHLGFDIDVVALEYIDDNYAGPTRLERIRALEQEYLFDYGERFQYVMLVGTDAEIPFAKITPYATGQGAVCPDLDDPNYKYSDWLYVDLTSDFDSNNNGCYADGALQSPDKLASGYTQDTGIQFKPNVALGRLPFTDPNTIRQVLANSMGFEKQSEAFKLNALAGMSMLALKGYYYGSACDGDNWGDHCVPPVPNDQSSYDTSLVAEQMMSDFLNINNFDTTVLYENEDAIAGGMGIISPVDLVEINLRTTLDEGRYGITTLAGHGSSTGVFRNFWVSDKNNNGVVDVREDSQTELSEVAFFNIDSTLNNLDSEGSRGSVFVLLACSNASPTNAENLAATILADGHGPASVAALSVVTVGSWFTENDHNAQSIGYYVNRRLLSRGYRLGESVWWTMADLLRKGKSGSGGVAYDLYGDPSLSFFGNPGGQSTQAAWSMGRRDPTGASYLTLPGPALPRELWEYETNTMGSGTLPPAPLVSNNGEVIVAAGNTVSVLRQGAVYQTLALDAPVFGSLALSADGTVYALDINGKLYSFPYRRLNLNGVTITTSSRYRRWAVNLDENPNTSPVIGSDGFIIAGTRGDLPTLWLVRPDGIVFSGFSVEGNLLHFAATGADRVIYATSTDFNNGYLYRFTQFCDFFVNPDVCPHSVIEDLVVATPFNTPPLLANGFVYVGDVDGNLIKVNKDTLVTLGSYTAESAIRTGPVLGPGGNLYFVTNNGYLYSLTQNLTLRWSKYLGSSSVTSIPALSTDGLYLVFNGYLRAYNLNSGEQMWQRAVNSNGGGSVSVGYGREVYTQLNTGDVQAFGEGWGLRPSLIQALPGVIGIRPYVRVEIMQSMPPITPTLTLDATPLAVPEAITADVVAIRLQRSADGATWDNAAWLPPGTEVFTDTNVSDNVAYLYRAQNIMSDGSNSDFTTTLDVIQTYPDLPPAPTLQPVVTDSATSLALSWDFSDLATADTFIIERSAAPGGPFSPVLTTGGEARSALDTGLTPGVTYYYRLRAGNPTGQSSPSGVQSGTTRSQTLAAPTNFVATLVAPGQILLTWDAGPAGALAVIEKRLFGETDFSGQASTPSGGSFTFYTGEPTAYDFRIKFVQGNAESVYAYSASVEIPVSRLLYLPLAAK